MPLNVTTTTGKQIEANRRNAQASTGPKTPEGKARSSQNARRHGLSAKHIAFADDEEREIFESLRDELHAALQPSGELENIYFDQAVFAQWNIRKSRILESQALSEAAAAAAPFNGAQNEARLRSIDRHARRHETSFHRAMREIRALQTERFARAQNEPAPPLAATRTIRQCNLHRSPSVAGAFADSLRDALLRNGNPRQCQDQDPQQSPPLARDPGPGQVPKTST
jgi:hypothetical protein